MKEIDRPDLVKSVGISASQWLERNRSLVLRQTPVWARTMAGIVISLATIGVTSAIFFRIDEVVSVSGQLVSIGGSVEVKAPVGGKVFKTYVKDGQIIKKGDLLIEFDTRQATEEKATLERLISIERADLNSKIKILAERSDVLQKKVDTSKTMVNELGKLVAVGGFQRLQYLQQLDELYALESQLASNKLEQTRMNLETEKSIGNLSSRLVQVKLQLNYQNVKSPSDGIIFNMKTRPEGVLQAGEPILSVVPQQGLSAEVFVPNKDIGFVKNGLTAKVRIDAFPFTRYGELIGSVQRIGADALPPNEIYPFYRFPVTLSLNRDYLFSDGIKVPLRSGMSTKS